MWKNGQYSHHYTNYVISPSCFIWNFHSLKVLGFLADEETEACAAREENVELDSDKNLGYQTTVVGMKRSMAFEMCDY